MNLASLSSADIRRILSLLEKKEAIHAELLEVEDQIRALQGGQPAVKVVSAQLRMTRIGAAKVKAKAVPVPTKKPTKAGKPAESGKSTLKEAIFEVLALAGEAGASVQDIAGKLGISHGHARVWFSTTGKKTGQIHKVGRGTYRLKAGK